MLHPSFLVGRIGRLRCATCGKSPVSDLKVFSQAILPARGEHVIVRIEFYCTWCKMITTSSAMLKNAEVAELLVDAIREGRFVSRFRNPINVKVRRPVSPSVANGTPSEPIDDAEVERASRILKRTSFKRDSKSWKQFMDRLERRK